jgi:hypothetical protein
VENLGLKIFGWIVGSSALLANALTVPKKLIELRKCKSGVALFNSAMLILVSVGDFLVGLHILILLSFDAHYGSAYCSKQLEWLTSPICSGIGILGSMASLMSLASMTVLSVYRAVNIGSLKKPSGINRRDIKLLGFTIFVSVTIPILNSVIPLVDKLEDFFVNGIYYGPENALFTGAPGVSRHVEIIRTYYGRMKEIGMDWGMIRPLISGMFSHDYDGISFTKLHFYGNHPVCLFKYLVTPNDPQQMFVWGTLVLYYFCACTISICYLKIWRVTAASASSAQLLATQANRLRNKRNLKLQRKITIIVATDIICWTPFMVVCVLHGIRVFDATPWYSIFVLALMPVNSVINPVILNETLFKYVCMAINFIRRTMRSVIPSKKPSIFGGDAQPKVSDVEDTNVTRNPMVKLKYSKGSGIPGNPTEFDRDASEHAATVEGGDIIYIETASAHQDDSEVSIRPVRENTSHSKPEETLTKAIPTDIKTDNENKTISEGELCLDVSERNSILGQSNSNTNLSIELEVAKGDSDDKR